MEYMVHVWGGAWNDDANPSIEKDYGIKEGYHYFKTCEEKDVFCEILNKEEYYKQGIARDIYHGLLTHKRTIFVGTFEYEEKQYVVHYDFGYEFSDERAKFQFLENNYCCDCNRSLFIREEYGDVIPELGCGNDIKLVDWHIEHWD